MSNIEFWFDIPDYEGLYQVSDLGRVKTLNYRQQSGVERILNQGTNNMGYKYVKLCKNGKQKQFYVHRLVAMAMIENPFPDEWVQVNHRDEDKTNNKVENLEWCDAKYNTNFGTGPYRRLTNRDSAINNPKLSKQVLCVETGEVYQSARDVERQLGYDHSSISACCRGRFKYSHGFHWKYI